MSDPTLFLAGSLSFLDEQYARYQDDPSSVDDTWRALFANPAALEELFGSNGGGNGHAAAAVASSAPVPASVTATGHTTWPLVNAYRVRGHLEANLDPLELLERPPHPELEPATYGFTEAEMDQLMPTNMYGKQQDTGRNILARLRETYCDTIGLEYMHISTPLKKQWLHERMETRKERMGVSPQTRKSMLMKLIASETFERFVHTKYPGTKRFSLEGSESLIPMLDQVLENLTRLGAIESVVGMAHRGRLSTLCDILGKPPRDIFSEFDDIEPEATLGGGDVKYHLGFSCDREDAAGNKMHVSLSFNPSHLEAVDPVVCGRVRAKQRRHKDWEHARCVGILVHGDAAFSGQGFVPETLNLSNLHGYKTGGTVHVIVNNQIGFTASPTEARSTPYCTDVAKMIQCPIWHVNGEDLDAVAQVVQMACEYRSQFQSDVVIDMFCYRKYGHNEMDEPSFTQPVMYKRIQEKHPVAALYAERLIGDGIVTADEVETMRHEVREHLEAELKSARENRTRPVVESLGGVWSGYRAGPDAEVQEPETRIDKKRLHEITEALVRVPDDFQCHPKIKRLFNDRDAMGHGEKPLDWGMAELLAYATVLREGFPVRLSGQDSSRGTFSHRHAVITDVDTGVEYMPLAHLHPDQADCRIYDSPLSEAGVLGFEFGYSLDFPDALVMWEAQFGDFTNGAQVIIDQFLSSSEDKWSRNSGLVMLLPHGFEGQGPEHSSARLERFLQQSAEDNWQIAQPTTPAQMFHLLRRQVKRKIRKPLVVMTPKSLLRLPAAKSDLSALTDGRFHRVLADQGKLDPAKVRRVLLCSGRVYYDLEAERAKREDDTVAIVRLELLYPWRADLVSEALASFEKADIKWVQDEPSNMGAWDFVRPLLHDLFGYERVSVVSRPSSASPATGSHKAHAIEQRQLLDQAFGE